MNTECEIISSSSFFCNERKGDPAQIFRGGSSKLGRFHSYRVRGVLYTGVAVGSDLAYTASAKTLRPVCLALRAGAQTGFDPFPDHTQTRPGGAPQIECYFTQGM